MNRSIYAFVSVLLLLWACAAPPTMKDAEQITTNTGVVFGSVEVYDDGELQKWGTRFFGYDHFYLMILPADSNEAITYKLDKEGEFFWSLPPGSYSLLGYIWDTDTGQRTGQIGASFSAPEPGVDVYIGTLVFRGNFYMLGQSIVDKFDKVAASYDMRFPDREGTAVRQVIEEHEPIGTFAALRGSCNEDWKIKCTKRFSGVTPVSPNVTQSGFPVVGDLLPIFRWKGCRRSDVSYDFVLYEAAAYAVGGALVPSYMRGRVVAYVEDLKQSEWQSKSALKPDTRYFWSVRLREGQTVSGWSTQGHSTFLLVYSSWGSGQWFQFKTT